jgi:hypothetical protein
VAGVQLLRRRSIEALLECRFECAALAIVSEELEYIFMGDAPDP